MKKIVFLSVLLWTWVPFARAQQVELFGYFESQLMGARVESSFLQLQSNKLRVDLEGTLSEKAFFAANFDYVTYHGETTWNLLECLPEKVTADVQPGTEPSYALTFPDRSFLDNAYLRLAFQYADLTVGKQQISLGTGYAWNPIDVFNTKDLLDPTYEQPGHNALRLDLPLGTTYMMTALYAVADEWENSDKMIAFKGRISHFDYELIGIEKAWTFHDHAAFDSVSSSFPALREKRRLVGLTTAGEVIGLGIWAEYAYNNMENTDNFHELVVGTDYTFDFQTYLMCEYYRNTLGKNDCKEYTLNDWMRYFTAEQKAISRDQLYVFLQHPATDLMDLALSAILSISDGSAAMVPTLNYRIFSNVELFAYLNLYMGEEGRAYSSNLGNGGLIRARVYF